MPNVKHFAGANLSTLHFVTKLLFELVTNQVIYLFPPESPSALLFSIQFLSSAASDFLRSSCSAVAHHLSSSLVFKGGLQQLLSASVTIPRESNDSSAVRVRILARWMCETVIDCVAKLVSLQLGLTCCHCLSMLSQSDYLYFKFVLSLHSGRSILSCTCVKANGLNSLRCDSWPASAFS